MSVRKLQLSTPPPLQYFLTLGLPVKMGREQAHRATHYPRTYTRSCSVN